MQDLKLKRSNSIGRNRVQPYEVHVTIDSIEDTAPFVKLCDEFTDWANTNVDKKKNRLGDSKVMSCKPIIIVMQTGKYKQQPMCSMFVNAQLDQAVRWGEVFGQYCSEREGYVIKRNKVEARFDNIAEGTPTIKGLSIEESTAFYWEFHIKLIFDCKQSHKAAEANIEQMRKAM